MFRTLGISKMYLNFNKQLITLRESDRVQLSDFVLYLPCSLQYFAGCNFKKSKLQSSDYFLLQTRKWCMSCMIQSLLYVYFYQGAISIYRSMLISIKCDKIISFCYKNGVYSTFDVDYIIIEAPSLRLSVGSLYFHYVANYFVPVVCISLCAEFSG